MSVETIDVGDLMAFLREAMEAGTIDLTTRVYAESDPEGNDFHPLRASVTYGHPSGRAPFHEREFTTDDGRPVRAICFGVGYDPTP